MPQVRNAFKIRSADVPIVETSQFLQLYSPLLLNQLQHEDLFVPKLIVVRGSPGSGKSSLLRLFETETLLSVHARRFQESDQDLVERLTELGILSQKGPMAVGIYIQCDSSLRDIANLSLEGGASLRLFYTLLDTRIVASFLRGLDSLVKAGCLDSFDDCVLSPLPPGDTPPRMFAESRTIGQLRDICSTVERAFGSLLNSFPGDPLPEPIQPHARVYSLPYLVLQTQSPAALSRVMPLVMLDDVQELYPEQRTHLKDEFIRRVAVPRWLAVRTQVFGLEDLVSLEGAEQGRDYREIALDEIFRDHPGLFKKFSANIVQRRLQATEHLQQITVHDFNDLLRPPDETIPTVKATEALEQMTRRASALSVAPAVLEGFRCPMDHLAKGGSSPTLSDMRNLEGSLIVLERQARKRQPDFFSDMSIPDVPDSKTDEAARLFVAERLHCPYYFGLDSLTRVASGNVEQLLSTVAVIADRMIYRAELDRGMDISAKDQERILRKCGEDYYAGIEEKNRRGSVIRQLVDNLGRFYREVTYRPNAPIAPGVNGFGLTREDLSKAVSSERDDTDARLLREVLTSAVAGNVMSIRSTKQGQAGSEKIVFYFNRLLCVKYGLPLSYGGFQPLDVGILIRMMQESVPLPEMVRRGGASENVLWSDEE